MSGTGGSRPRHNWVWPRVKALAVADPVLDLERRKPLLTSRDWAGYQMEELALTAIDTVTLRMDFEDGARHEDVVAAWPASPGSRCRTAAMTTTSR